MGFKRTVGIAIGAIAMLAVAGPALAQEAPSKDEVFTRTTTILAGAKALVSFDISWFDPEFGASGTYFLADRSNNQIDVVDPSTNTNKPIAQGIFAGVVLNPDGTANNDKSGPDGVLTVHQAGGVTELWVGDSPGRVWVLNASTGTPISGFTNPISVGGTTRADELCFDSKDHLIMIASPGEGDGVTTFPYVTFISTTTHQVVVKLHFDGKNGTVPAAGGLEQCGWSPETGKFYQNVPVNGNASDGSGVTAVIDPQTVLKTPPNPQVEQNFPIPIADCGLPQGMAIGPNNQVMLGCNGPSTPSTERNTAMINIRSGAIIATFPALGGTDEVWFNEGDGHYFFPSCNTECRVPATGATGPEVLAVIDSTGHRLDQSVQLATKLGNQTGRRAHSVAADPVTNQVYVPIPACSVLPMTTPPTCNPAGNDASICNFGNTTAITGCIAVFTATNDDGFARAKERGEDDNQQ
jgi:hypothetical protein